MFAPESVTHLLAPRFTWLRWVRDSDESVTHLLAPESFEKETYYWSILAPDSVTHLIAPESVTRLLAPKSSGFTWHGLRLRWVRDSSTCPRNLLVQHLPLRWEEITPPAQHNSNMYIHICIICNYIRTHCYTLQHTATHCNTLQHAAICVYTYASYVNITEHTATHCNTLQHTAICVYTSASYVNITQDTATHCNPLQYVYKYMHHMLI